MKKYITIIALVFIASACNDKPEIEQKKEELAQLKSQLVDLKSSVATLEKEIDALDTTKKEDNYILVTTAQPKKGSFEHRIDVRGSIQSRSNVQLSAEIGGKIESIKVKEGQAVKKGQTLIVINADVVRNNIAELKTSLELASTLFERQKKLWDQQIGTEIQYLEAKNRKEGLERKLSTANAQLAMSIIKAPFAGTIDDLPVNEGELAIPGMPVTRIVNPKDMYINAEVSEAFIGKINNGDQVIVDFITQDQKLKSIITSVSQVVKSANRTFSVEIKMPQLNFSAKPNQVVVISMRDYFIENALSVPTKILQKDNAGNFVFKAMTKGGNLASEKIHITLGKSFNGNTEVLSGLNGNEKIILKGNRDVAQGTIIKIAEES